MGETIRWGILGLGAIAHSFAKGLQVVREAKLVAVGSRSKEKADAFADQYGVSRRHESYAALARDPDVDAIYIATPHTLHKENSLLCLEAGKSVLCEKPMAVNAREVGDMITCARTNGVLLMEAMWTRFLPLTGKVREWLREGAIGEVRILTADLGFRAGWNPQGRLLNPELAGGALLDVGVYPVAYASMVFGGPPSRVTGIAHLGPTGVDEQAAMTLGYDQGQLALLHCAIRTRTPQEAWIIGTEGSIHVPHFWRAGSATLERQGSDPERVEMPFSGNGYNYEAEEVVRCLREGRPESELMPLDESLSILRTMDRLRDQWGLEYPME